jgi:hypothetical protein
MYTAENRNKPTRSKQHRADFQAQGFTQSPQICTPKKTKIRRISLEERKTLIISIG